MKDTSKTAAVTYEASPSTTAINEGQTLTTNVFTTGVKAGTTLYWRVLPKEGGGGVAAGDFSVGALEGSDTLGANSQIQIRHTLSSDQSINEGDEQFRIALYSDSARKTQVAITPFITVKDTSSSPYGIIPSATTINEGQTLTTTVRTTGVKAGTTLYWAVGQRTTGVTSQDFNGGALQGFGTVGANGEFTFSHVIANDLSANEGDEDIRLRLFTDPNRQNFVSETPYITIKDTSTALPYTISPSTTTISEGQTLTTTVGTTGIKAGTTLYWQILQRQAAGGVTTGDFSSGALQGSGSVGPNGRFSFAHTLSNDGSSKEGDEQFWVGLYSDPARKTEVAVTPIITVADTSKSITDFVYTNKDWSGQDFKKLQTDGTVKSVDGSVSFVSKYFKSAFTGREEILDQPWVPGRPTIVYAHGWKDSPGYRDTNTPSAGLDPNASSQLLFNGLLERYGNTHNIVLVDWTKLAQNTNYPGPLGLQPIAEISVTKQVGETVAEALLQAGAEPATLTLIGHSLGSYVMSAAADYIVRKYRNTATPKKVAELVGLDPAFGLGYDIDARNGVYGAAFGNLSQDPPISFTTDIATKTRTYTASDLEPLGKAAGDNAIAASAEKSYLVQYSKTDFSLWPQDLGGLPTVIAAYHNAVIGVYGDLVRKGIEDPGNHWDLNFDNSFDAAGLPNTAGPFDGVIVAAQPWVKTPNDFLVPRAIGWTNGYTGISIYGSPKSDVLFHDRFDSKSISTAGTRLRGGDGDDFLVAGDQSDNRGFDELYGDKGSDTFVFGYRRYLENHLPYRDKWLTDVIGNGLDSYAVIKDFDPKEDKLLLGISKEELRIRKADDIDASLKAKYGDGVGLLYSNSDLFAYIPNLSYEDALTFLNGGRAKTRYEPVYLFNLESRGGADGSPTLFQNYQGLRD